MKISNKAKKIYEEAIIIDNQLGFEPAMPWSFTKKWELVDRYARAGFTALTLSLANDESSPEETLAYLAQIRKHIAQHPEKYILAKSQEDILRAKRENKIALRLMFQGTSPIGKNLDLLELYHELGISSMILAYNISTPIGNGVIEVHDNGLSYLGKNFVGKMNELGMLIDGAHTGYQTAMDAINLTNKPFLFSHTGIYGVYQHVRNVKDEQIIAAAKTGGVIGITGLGVLLGDPEASIEKFVDHIDYVTKLVGSKHIAIGLDNLYFADQFGEFMATQTITHPQAYAQKVSAGITWKCIEPEDLISVVELLLQRGYSEDEVKGILGGNMLRLM